MKRRSPEDGEELLLFDLPLNDRSVESKKREAPAVTRAPSVAASAPAQPLLITEDTPVLGETVIVIDAGVGIAERLLAGVADLFLHLLVLGLTALAVVGMHVPLTLGDWPAFLILGLLFSCVYTVISLAFWGKTPGMAWMGHFARSVTDEPLTFGQTFLRWLGALLTLTLVGLPLLLVFAGGRSMSDRLSDSKTLHHLGEGLP